MMLHMRDKEKFKEGVKQGREEGETLKVLLLLIRKKLQRNLSTPVIADMLELEVDYVEKVVQLLEEFPDEGDREIAEILLRK